MDDNCHAETETAQEKTVPVTELTFLDEDQHQIHADIMTLGQRLIWLKCEDNG